MKNTKQRLFEVMERVNSDFKPKLNEDTNQGINPNYTHFAITKDTNKIVNGWDYSDVEPAELRQFRKDYFFNDLTGMGINPNSVNVVTTKYLQKSGMNPFDMTTWS